MLNLANWLLRQLLTQFAIDNLVISIVHGSLINILNILLLKQAKKRKKFDLR